MAHYQLLRIHTWFPLVRDTLGPGTRAVVWVQGCSHRCPGCMMPESWDTSGGLTIDPIALANECLASDEVEGITISGGEPFDQPEAVASLLSLIKQHGRNTWVYTGYTIEELIARNELIVDNLLSCCDVLVDGPYQEENGDVLRYRGSANQRIIRLTDAISAERINTGGKSRVDMTLDSNDRLVIVGIPPRGFMKTFRDKMGERGLVVKEIDDSDPRKSRAFRRIGIPN